MMKGTVEAGEGSETPQSGDLVRAQLRGAAATRGHTHWLCGAGLCAANKLAGNCKHHPCVQVFLHYSLLNEHRDVLCSTHKEHGGSGRPQPFVIGRGRRMLRGMELGVQGMPGCLGAGCRVPLAA